MQAPNFVDFKNFNDSATGTLTGSKVEEGNFGPREVFYFTSEKGNQFKVSATSDLKRKLKSVEVGTKVRMTYIKDQPPEKGKSGNPAGVSKAAAAFKRIKQKAFRQKVTAAEFDQVLDGLLAAAKEGDAACIRLVLDNTIGPPLSDAKNTVNILNVLPPAETRPRLSIEEWREKATQAIEAKK